MLNESIVKYCHYYYNIVIIGRMENSESPSFNLPGVFSVCCLRLKHQKQVKLNCSKINSTLPQKLKQENECYVSRRLIGLNRALVKWINLRFAHVMFTAFKLWVLMFSPGSSLPTIVSQEPSMCWFCTFYNRICSY